MDINGITKWLNYLRFEDKGLLQQAHHSIKVFFLLSNPGSTQPIVCYLSDMWARRTVQIKFGCDYHWVTSTLKTNKMISNWYACFYWNKQLHLTAIRRSQSITKWSYFAIDISRSAIKTFPRYNLIPQLLLHRGQCLSRALYFYDRLTRWTGQYFSDLAHRLSMCTCWEEFGGLMGFCRF